MIKIAYLVSTLKRCGPINGMYNIIKHLNKEKYQIFIITLSKEGSNTRIDDFIKLECEIVPIENGRLSGYLLNPLKVKKILQEKKIDLIHSRGIRGDLILEKLDLKISFSSVHNDMKKDYINTYGWFIGNVLIYFHLKALKKIKNKVACSSSLAKKYAEYGIDMNFIPNGVDTQTFNKKNYDKTKLRKKLTLPMSTIFIYTGNIVKGKNIVFILNYFFENSDKNDVLVLVGEGEEKKLYEEKYKSPKIYFLGHKTNIVEYLAASDYYISASYSEGMPNSVLEAMSMGLPCFLSDIDQHKEVVRTSKELQNLVFRNDDSLDLSNRIIKTKKDEYSMLSEIAQEIAEKKFSSQSMSQLYECEYKKILETSI